MLSKIKTFAGDSRYSGKPLRAGLEFVKTTGYALCLSTGLALVDYAQAAGPRPFFEAPFPCAQVWKASTYKTHGPDPDSLDFAERDQDNKIISKGQPVLASAPGEIIKSVQKNGKGEYEITIDHGNGWRTWNVHMEADSTKPMKVGRKLAQGEMIARTSNTGAEHVHQHYSQIRDGEAVRVKMHGVSVKTHQGNKDTWKLFGTGKEEEVISLNCAGNTFMGWNQGGDRYHQIYKPGTGQTKIIRANSNGATMTSTWEGKWSRGWTHFIPYYSGSNHPHAIVYKASTGKVSFIRLNLNGNGVTNLKTGSWWKGWTHFVPLKLGGKPHFLAYDSVHGYANIDRIHQTGDGTKNVYKKTWVSGRTQIVPFIQGPSQYLLLYKGGDGGVKIVKVSGSGNNISTTDVWSGNWSTGYTNIVPVSHAGARYLLAYKAATGAAKVIKIKSGAKGVSTTATMNWSKGWTAFSPFSHNGKGHILVYKTGTGDVKTLRLKSNGSGVDTLWNKKWTWGWM